MRKTVLIFGISSFVGSNLAEALKEDYRVVGTYFKTPVNIPGVTCFPCDILKKDYVMKLMAIIKPDFTIYAIGLSSLTECKQRPKLADALNSAGAANACTASERYRSKFVVFSSCFVHGGDDLNYTEGDTPFPNTVYGTSLSSTEFYVQRSCLNYLILRCAPLYGWSYGAHHPNWFEGLQKSLAKNENFSADDTVKTGFLDIKIVGKILKKSLEANVTNRLLQVSSVDLSTRYEFARTYARLFKHDENLIQRALVNFPAEKKTNKEGSQELFFRMSTANLEEFLGTKLPLIEESLLYTRSRTSKISEKNS